ncbi:MAG: FHA domain-containing protein [Gemmataceae bacterium]|nr:FHA domain-containing protein [Gemmataceae bacterium]MCI0739231.1 FHA domain-containing protein [Gemmataceae bacterium]
MPAQLLALTDGPNILLDKPILLLGRHQECDIQIPSRKISRRHCCIAQVNDHLVVRDLHSTNGVRINGTRVQEGVLNAGDELTIGNYRYQVTWSGQPMSPKPELRRPSELAPAESDKSSHQPRQFDSCEQPIALDDADPNAPAALPLSPGVPKGVAPPLVPLNPPLSPTIKKDSPSGILPDDLQIAPH